MGIISSIYRKNLLLRYDKDPAIPYYGVTSFNDLKKEDFSFQNSRDANIKYFYYYRDGYQKDKIILFCPGIGPGHTAYLKEINELTLNGYKVLTLDYMGCGASSGSGLYSFNEPTRDVLELLNVLDIKEDIILFGHSLGAFTALNVINKKQVIKKAIIMSGFISLEYEILFLVKNKFATTRIIKYEHKIEPEYFGIDNIKYLKETSDKLFFIHSTDDQMVGFETSFKVVKEMNNPNIELLEMNNKKHNPDYSFEAIEYMTSTFAEYNSLIKNKKLKTVEERIEFFKDKSIDKMTELDADVFRKIIDFIGK